jgi:ADP-ribose pyrophosphatase YjhB (NUDIX family)
MANYCNNCGKRGHLFHQCKIPITSIGVIVFRKNLENKIEYLCIRRKDTLGYIDFMRGKYSVYNKHYIMNMLKQMTNKEKQDLLSCEFDMLWRNIWGDDTVSSQYKTEENISREKFNNLLNGVYVNNNYETSNSPETTFYNLSMLIDESMNYECWHEPEWGFPKGRRNHQEKDFECALREMTEETGYSSRLVRVVKNVFPFEEVFTGSNYKSYKHKYFLMYMDYADSVSSVGEYERSEVSDMDWKTYEKCLNCFRSYNLEKKRVISNVNTTITKYKLFFTDK